MVNKRFAEKKTTKPQDKSSSYSIEFTDEDEIIAVIMAAIATYTQGRGRILSIKSSSSTVPLWSLAGRQNLMR